MATIYITKLNKEIKQNIINHSYSLTEMKEIQNSVKDILRTKQKGFRTAFTMITVITLLMLVLTLPQIGFNSATIFVILGIVLSVALVLVFTWFAQIGNLKNQYNKAVKQGYPKDAAQYVI